MVDEDKQIKDGLLAELQERRQKIKRMGGREAVERQEKRGKLTARERIDRLLDKGPFREVAAFTQGRSAIAGAGVPSDAVITG